MKIIDGLFCRLYSFVIMLYLIIKDRHTLYVYMWPHIGDTCIAMAYLRAYREQYNVSHITILTKKQNYELCNSYDGAFERAVFFNEKQLFRLSKTRFVIRFLRMLHTNIDNHFICTTPFLFDARLLHSEDITAGLITKRVIYNLKGKVAPVFPRIPSLNSAEYHNFCADSKKIIISPYASSVSEIDTSYWDELADRLSNMGYSIYTNTTSNRSSIKGTKRLECSLIELLAYANQADAFIAIRSGIVDLIAGCNCRIIVLYNDYIYSELYNLSAWGKDYNLFQLYGVPSIEQVISLL